jgi:hypothetical protein
MFPKALILYLGTSGAKPRDYPCSYTFHASSSLPECDCSFIRQLRWFCEKKLTKKIIFYSDDEALKVFRKYRCHPVHHIHPLSSPRPGGYKEMSLSWLTNSALVYTSPNAGGWGVAGSQPMSKAVHIT